MTDLSPFKTFEPGAAGTLLQRQKIPPDFPEADIPHCPICHGIAALGTYVSEAHLADFAKSRHMSIVLTAKKPFHQVAPARR